MKHDGRFSRRRFFKQAGVILSILIMSPTLKTCKNAFLHGPMNETIDELDLCIEKLPKVKLHYPIGKKDGRSIFRIPVSAINTGRGASVANGTYSDLDGNILRISKNSDNVYHLKVLLVDVLEIQDNDAHIKIHDHPDGRQLYINLMEGDVLMDNYVQSIKAMASIDIEELRKRFGKQ